ncbi:MAG TPA: flagellar assembly peptidoglycan hydrolase FlgJ [Macromonas sp.]|nr:flagellar assembly peptidoglycan hydrolase FlgJ [Macromonas sp.]
MNPSTLSLAGQRGLAADVKSLDRLNAQAGKDGRTAIKETARQFEALFMQELLKSMREATMKSGLVENESSDLGTQLLDQQWAQQMTGLPGGLGDMIEKQLSQQMGGSSAAGGQSTVSLGALRDKGGVEARQDVSAMARATKTTVTQARFVTQHTQAAEQVAKETGIPASYMVGQAAHETGWGRREIRNADGSSANNLFGIKAGASWKGKVAVVTTTEYINGVPRQIKAKFRAYDSPADSFRDYAKLIGNSPRYAQVMDNLHSAQAFASGLQKAGYATDPQYASKLSRIIHTTLNLQRAQA